MPDSILRYPSSFSNSKAFDNVKASILISPLLFEGGEDFITHLSEMTKLSGEKPLRPDFVNRMSKFASAHSLMRSTLNGDSFVAPSEEGQLGADMPFKHPLLLISPKILWSELDQAKKKGAVDLFNIFMRRQKSSVISFQINGFL